MTKNTGNDVGSDAEGAQQRVEGPPAAQAQHEANPITLPRVAFI